MKRFPRNQERSIELILLLKFHQKKFEIISMCQEIFFWFFLSQRREDINDFRVKLNFLIRFHVTKLLEKHPY